MSSTTNTRTHLGSAALLAIALFHPGALAQESQAERAFLPTDQHIDQLATLLTALDDKARACLETEPTANSENSNCQQLIAAIDGNEIANYLAGCANLKDWRDGYIAEFQNENLSSQDLNEEQALRLLVQTEYLCGEDALRRRTEYVFPAFAALAQAMRTETPRATAVRNGSVQRGDANAMQERLRRETEQLWLDLEIENLRQSVPRANRF